MSDIVQERRDFFRILHYEGAKEQEIFSILGGERTGLQFAPWRGHSFDLAQDRLALVSLPLARCRRDTRPGRPRHDWSV